MSLFGAYDRDNIFAKILRGEMPSTKVFEDDVVLAIMDVFPQSRGHVLVKLEDSKIVFEFDASDAPEPAADDAAEAVE